MFAISSDLLGSMSESSLSVIVAQFYRSHVVPAGMNTKFTASVRGKPEPRIRWFKSGTEIADGGLKYRINNVGGKKTT